MIIKIDKSFPNYWKRRWESKYRLLDHSVVAQWWIKGYL